MFNCSSIPTWFESLPSTSKDQPDVIVIWEGVAALESPMLPLSLFKFIGDDLFQMVLPVNNSKVISNGYWTCAEVRGIFEGGEALIYHAETPEKAEAMITAIADLIGSPLRDVVVRLDPDPLRLLDTHSIEKRLDEWTELCRSLTEKWTIVFDSNMPLMSARFVLCLLLSTLALSTVSANEIRQKRDDGIFTLLQALLGSLGGTLNGGLDTTGGVLGALPITTPFVGANGRPVNIDLQSPLGGLGKGVDGIVGSVLGTVIKSPSVTTGAPVASTPAAAPKV